MKLMQFDNESQGIGFIQSLPRHHMAGLDFNQKFSFTSGQLNMAQTISNHTLTCLDSDDEAIPKFHQSPDATASQSSDMSLVDKNGAHDTDSSDNSSTDGQAGAHDRTLTPPAANPIHNSKRYDADVAEYMASFRRQPELTSSPSIPRHVTNLVYGIESQNADIAKYISEQPEATNSRSISSLVESNVFKTNNWPVEYDTEYTPDNSHIFQESQVTGMSGSRASIRIDDIEQNLIASFEAHETEETASISSEHNLQEQLGDASSVTTGEVTDSLEPQDLDLLRLEEECQEIIDALDEPLQVPSIVQTIGMHELVSLRDELDELEDSPTDDAHFFKAPEFQNSEAFEGDSADFVEEVGTNPPRALLLIRRPRSPEEWLYHAHEPEGISDEVELARNIEDEVESVAHADTVQAAEATEDCNDFSGNEEEDGQATPYSERSLVFETIKGENDPRGNDEDDEKSTLQPENDDGDLISRPLIDDFESRSQQMLVKTWLPSIRTSPASTFVPSITLSLEQLSKMSDSELTIVFRALESEKLLTLRRYPRGSRGKSGPTVLTISHSDTPCSDIKAPGEAPLAENRYLLKAAIAVLALIGLFNVLLVVWAVGFGKEREALRVVCYSWKVVLTRRM
ncbi:hypothetical protein P170DRAFT_461825 [Aspergillus steynii IBT 23096]|uniref:Uncharacterized protein n=1 Tax=Aspergillus steynii IBT 23096 TaxID=1392250 RepID=A0A2I2GFJ8_9EURO|nr:uncharacterized protein P170DRAFT_461825 [Aspergillus steynii IBT 23096]PLB51653.1 hypothetical protein P170DRAFT_461825 [Aspergillus steynii IBT 23096]